MSNRNNKIIFLGFSLLLLAGALFLFSPEVQAAPFQYTPMERIPGFETETGAATPDLKVWIESLYKFAIWVVGICALFMISVGGFTYMTSAGNTSTASTGKKIITDAVIGLILALVAVLLFTVINPRITTVNLQITPVSVIPAGTPATPPTTPPGGPTAPQPTPPPAGGDTCATYPNTNNVINFTTPDKKKVPEACAKFESAFEAAASTTGIKKKILKAIASAESSCKPNEESTSNPPSCGLMQLQPSTARAIDPNVTDCAWLKSHPTESILIAAKYIKANQGTHGGVLEKLFAGYNAGYGAGNNPDGKKQAFAPSSDCPGAVAYQCCINPGGFDETQGYIFNCTKFYNFQ